MSEIENKELTPEKESGLNFVEQMVADDLKNGKNGGRLNTRFPPEPNGYLHIGHAKAICMDFGVAEKFGGTCNLRFDDTNPVKEDVEYVDSIREDIKWLGYDWGNREYYASDYFPQLYDLAIRMIKEGKAYVDEQTAEQIAEQKGTPTQPGQLSGVSSIIAEHGANVVSVNYDSTDLDMNITDCFLKLGIETRDNAHIESIKQALTSAGFEVCG